MKRKKAVKEPEKIIAREPSDKIPPVKELKLLCQKKKPPVFCQRLKRAYPPPAPLLVKGGDGKETFGSKHGCVDSKNPRSTIP